MQATLGSAERQRDRTELRKIGRRLDAIEERLPAKRAPAKRSSAKRSSAKSSSAKSSSAGRRKS